MIAVVLVIIGALVLLLIILALSAIRVVQQYERGVIFVLGRLTGAKGPGLFLVPSIHLTHEQSRPAYCHAHGAPARGDHAR